MSTRPSFESLASRPDLPSPPSALPPALHAWLLRLRVERPTELSVTVLVAGELDLHTAPRLRELLTQRLHGAVSAVTVDLSEVTFLGMAGVRVLYEAHLLAEQQAVELQIIVGGSRSARRALMACGADEKLSILD